MVGMLTAARFVRPLAILCVTLTALPGCGGGVAVTPESIREATARWERAKVRDYDLEWSSSGPRTTHFAVTVRDGLVRAVEFVAPDGRRHPARPGDPQLYGVDGLFLTIADELAQLDQPTPFGQPKGTRAVLRFTPDPRYGYPRRYRRDVMGAPSAVAIDVLRFTPKVPGEGRPSP